MIPTLPLTAQNDTKQLAQRYGQPLVSAIDLGITSLFDPLDKTDRYGEVCMVVRRLNGRILTMKKTYEPRDTFRLMTGGINYGEQVLHALLRETNEETGLQVNVSRFLAAITYRKTNSDTRPIFYSFAFLLDEISGTLGAIDEEEQAEAFLEVEPKALRSVAEHLSHLDNLYSQDIRGHWDDWGRFRAVIHNTVAEALSV